MTASQKTTKKEPYFALSPTKFDETNAKMAIKKKGLASLYVVVQGKARKGNHGTGGPYPMLRIKAVGKIGTAKYIFNGIPEMKGLELVFCENGGHPAGQFLTWRHVLNDFHGPPSVRCLLHCRQRVRKTPASLETMDFFPDHLILPSGRLKGSPGSHPITSFLVFSSTFASKKEVIFATMFTVGFALPCSIKRR